MYIKGPKLQHPGSFIAKMSLAEAPVANFWVSPEYPNAKFLNPQGIKQCWRVQTTLTINVVRVVLFLCRSMIFIILDTRHSSVSLFNLGV